jgi:FAD/FMN-containing dehydrogenase
MPFLPVEQHGKLVVLAMLVHAGGGEAGERAVAPFRALAKPLADMVRPMRYPEIYPPDQEGYHPVAVSRTMFLDAIDRGVGATILERLRESKAQMAVTQIRVLGGAVARVPAEATAYAHRARGIMVNVAALYEQPEEKSDHEAWVAATAESIRQGTPAAYVNFLGDEGEARVREAYPEGTWQRLAEIKRRYDPTNVFRLNQNIPPAGGAATR